MSKSNFEYSIASKELGKEFAIWISDIKSPIKKIRNSRNHNKSSDLRLIHPDKFERLQYQCCHFNPVNQSSHIQLKRSVSKLCRGQQVVKNALMWTDPFIGSRRTLTDQIRGEQWRLVMAWSGLEMIVSELIGSVKMERIEFFIEKLEKPESLINYEPFKFNCDSLKMKSYIYSEDEQSSVIDFFDITNKETKHMFTRFFHERDSFHKPHEGLVLAKSFRHLIAHGSLSPTKIIEWGLRPLFNRLTLEIGLVSALTFKTMNSLKKHML
jgi:hypothetical protein